MAKVLIFIITAIFFSIIFSNPVLADQSHLWTITSIDTMKYSRDAAEDPDIYNFIPTQVEQVAQSGANHIALDTPYDNRFLPVLEAWVDQARKNNLLVWFRGNFSGWEGWFDTPKFTDYHIHHQLTFNFITSHPNLFRDGDIFTPVPEPENGAIGDPRITGKVSEFNQFLIDSYNNCNLAFEQIHKKVICGYFSTNGDIAKQILTENTVKNIGGVVVIDHYTSNPDQQEKDILTLYNKFHSLIVLGEFGAPIPDLNGQMTETEQATFISKLLEIYYKHKDIIAGVNYWTLAGGSTSLLNNDFSPRQAFQVIKNYFAPAQLDGYVFNTLNNPIPDVKVTTDNSNYPITSTDNSGYFQLFLPENQYHLLILQSNNYQTVSLPINPQSPIQSDLKITLSPTNPSIIYQIRLIFKPFQDNFNQFITKLYPF